MKKLVSVIVGIMMVISIIQAPMAVNSSVQEKSNYRLYINGKLSGLSSSPVMVNNVILIESKDLLTKLGIQNYNKIFIWDKKKNNITVNAGKNIVIKLTIGSKTAYNNKEKVQLSSAPVVYKNKVYLPVDSIAKFLNFKLAIDNAAKCIFIKSFSEYNKIKSILDNAQKSNISAKNIQFKTRIFGSVDGTLGDLGVIIKYDKIANLMSLNYSVTSSGITANVETYIINGMLYTKEDSSFRYEEDEDDSDSDTYDEDSDNSNSWEEDDSGLWEDVEDNSDSYEENDKDNSNSYEEDDEDNSNSYEEDDEDNSDSYDEDDEDNSDSYDEDDEDNSDSYDEDDEDNSNSYDEDEDNSNSYEDDEDSSNSNDEDLNGWEKAKVSDEDINSTLKTVYFPLTELMYCSMSMIKENNDEIVLSGPCWSDKNVLNYNLDTVKVMDKVDLNTVITINKKGNYISKVVMKSNNINGEKDQNLEIDVEYTLNNITIDIPAELKEE